MIPIKKFPGDSVKPESPGRKLSLIAVAVMLVAPAIMVVAPSGSASDFVSFTQGERVPWKNMTNLKTNLHFKSVDSDDDPSTPNVLTMDTTPPPSSTTNLGQSTSFAIVNGQALPVGPPTAAQIRSAPMTHEVNVSGSNALAAVWSSQGASGATWRVSVRTEGPGAESWNTVEITDVTGGDDGEPHDPCPTSGGYQRCTATIPFPHGKQRFTIREDARIVVQIEAVAAGQLSAAAWQLRTNDPGRPSYFEIRTENGVRTASWTTNPVADTGEEVTRYFRPNKNPVAQNKLTGWFAVKSAFGGRDVCCTLSGGEIEVRREFEPTAHVLYAANETPLPITLANLTSIDLVLDETNTTVDDGLIAYKFPATLWDYWKWPYPTGEFILSANGRLRPDDPLQSASVEAKWRFVISEQTITLRPYDDDDDDPNEPTPLESQAHDVASGGTTTFLVYVKNNANFSDNLTLTAVPGQIVPPVGWSVAIGGERVVGGGRLPLGPGEEQLVKVTVRAPDGAPAGESATYTFRATSTLDPSVRSSPYAVIATVTNIVRDDVDIVLLRDLETVRPGQDNFLKAFVWNRGTRPANLSLEVRQVDATGWNISLMQNAVEGPRVVVPSVGAGDITAVTLRVRPDLSAVVGSDHEITLNATLADIGAEGPGEDRKLILRLMSISSFRVELLKGINANVHYIEMACMGAGGGATPSPPNLAYCPGDGEIPEPGESEIQDAVNGTWFRAWVTNTGDVTDTYTARITQASEEALASVDPRQDAFPGASGIDIGVMRPDGSFNGGREHVTLNPGETGELYVWVPHEGNSAVFQESELKFTLAVQSQNTKVELKQPASVLAQDADDAGGLGGESTRKNAVKIEHVERTRSYFEGGEPIVNIRDARNVSAKKLVDLSGTPTKFFVRVTNGASWRPLTAEGEGPVKLSFASVAAARLDGWNVSMRLRNGELDEKKNPWVETLEIDNFNERTSRWESFLDQEVEVKVVPPLNGSARPLAGNKLTFSLTGTQTGPETQHFTTSIEFVAEVASRPNITMWAGRTTEFVQPGQQTAFTLYLANNGSIDAPVSIKSRVTEDSPNAAQWSVTQQNTNLTAHQNRTVALVVGAPGNVAPGDRAVIQVEATFPEFPTVADSPLITRYVNLTALVKPASTLRLNPVPSAVQAAPGAAVNFTMEVTNTDPSKRINYEVSVAPVLAWTQSFPTGAPVVEASQTTRFAYLLEVPTNGIVTGASYQSVVKIAEVGNPDNFDIKVVTINIVGGQALPLVQVVRSHDLVERGGVTKFEMSIRNVGNVGDTLPLEARAGSASWESWVEDAGGAVITGVNVEPNQVRNVFLVVKAPRIVAEGTSMPVTLTAYNPAFDRSSSGTVRGVIHDFGVDVELLPPRADLVAGDGAEFTVRVTNLGNGNDTINLTADMQGLREWTADFAETNVRLAPGSTSDVRLVVRSSKEPLPTPRGYTLGVNAASAGGLAAGIPKNDSAPVVVNVLSYRAFDVDGDGLLELAVDRNKRAADGFETFQEIFRDADSTQVHVVDNLSGKQDGKLSFLLDVPESGAYDGVADVYFDPNDPFVYAIEFTPDINGDATPDYLLDVDNDGVIDHAWDTTTRTLWPVTTIFAFGGTKPQFLVDTNRDGEPDRYYDPEKGIVTRTIPQDDDRVGIDTDGSGKASKLFDTNSGTVTDASVAGLNDFFREYPYFFLVFALVIVLFGIVLAKRRRGPS